MAAHGRLESENRNAMALHGRQWLAISPGNGLVMASNGRPWPGMVGHVRTMASQWSAKDPALKDMAAFGISSSQILLASLGHFGSNLDSFV